MINLFVKYRGLQVLLVLAVYLLLAQFLPLTVHQTFYTFSIFIKDVLMWILPLTVGLFIAHAVSSFKHRAPLFIITLIVFETISNFSSVWYAYLGAHISADFLPTLKPAVMNGDFAPLWRLSFARPLWWTADKGALLGVVIGFIAALSNRPLLRQFIDEGKAAAQWVLSNVFSRIIPLFVLGFVARMYQMQLFQHMITHYGLLLVWLVAILAVYLVFLFWVGSGLKGMPQAIKNLLPAGGVAFTSGCSISTMPWTIEGTSKNLQNHDLAKSVIPATTNIQQIGDCITNTFLCFLIYRHFFGHSPDLITWLNFSCLFVIARFATAAVIGGAIFIMLPIYETHLAFTTEMIAIILAFNVILDPLVTCTNVVANGALCRVFERVWTTLTEKIKRSPVDEER
jgi:Na+/H+-dicarboxylate symporter